MKAFILGAMMLLSSTSFASFSGNYYGSGTALGASCPNVHLWILNTPNAFEIKSIVGGSAGGLICNNTGIPWDPIPNATVNGSQLILNNEVIGTITDTSFHAVVGDNGCSTIDGVVQNGVLTISQTGNCGTTLNATLTRGAP